MNFLQSDAGTEIPSYRATAQSMDRFGEIAAYVVIFATAFVFSLLFIREQFLAKTATGAGYLAANPAWWNQLWWFVVSLIATLPLLWFFLFLSKAVSNLKALEIKRIDERLAKIVPGQDRDLEKSLIRERELAEKANRWILGAGVGSRLVVLLVVAVQAYTLL